MWRADELPGVLKQRGLGFRVKDDEHERITRSFCSTRTLFQGVEQQIRGYMVHDVDNPSYCMALRLVST